MTEIRRNILWERIPTSTSLGRREPKKMRCTICPQRRVRRTPKLASTWKTTIRSSKDHNVWTHQHTTTAFWKKYGHRVKVAVILQGIGNDGRDGNQRNESVEEDSMCIEKSGQILGAKTENVVRSRHGLQRGTADAGGGHRLNSISDFLFWRVQGATWHHQSRVYQSLPQP